MRCRTKTPTPRSAKTPPVCIRGCVAGVAFPSGRPSLSGDRRGSLRNFISSTVKTKLIRPPDKIIIDRASGERTHDIRGWCQLHSAKRQISLAVTFTVPSLVICLSGSRNRVGVPQFVASRVFPAPFLRERYTVALEKGWESSTLVVPVFFRFTRYIFVVSSK